MDEPDRQVEVQVGLHGLAQHCRLIDVDELSSYRPGYRRQRLWFERSLDRRMEDTGLDEDGGENQNEEEHQWSGVLSAADMGSDGVPMTSHYRHNHASGNDLGQKGSRSTRRGVNGGYRNSASSKKNTSSVSSAGDEDSYLNDDFETIYGDIDLELEKVPDEEDGMVRKSLSQVAITSGLPPLQIAQSGMEDLQSLVEEQAATERKLSRSRRTNTLNESTNGIAAIPEIAETTDGVIEEGDDDQENQGDEEEEEEEEEEDARGEGSEDELELDGDFLRVEEEEHIEIADKPPTDTTSFTASVAVPPDETSALIPVDSAILSSARAMLPKPAPAIPAAPSEEEHTSQEHKPHANDSGIQTVSFPGVSDYTAHNQPATGLVRRNSSKKVTLGPHSGSLRTGKKVILLCRAAERLRFGIEQFIPDHPSDGHVLSSRTNMITLHVVGYARGSNPTPNRLKAFLNASTNLAFCSTELGPNRLESHLVDRAEIDALTALSLNNAKRYRQAGELFQRAASHAWTVASSFPCLDMTEWALSLDVMALYAFFQYDPLLPETTMLFERLASFAPKDTGPNRGITTELPLFWSLQRDPLSEQNSTEGFAEETRGGARAVITALYRPLSFVFIRTLMRSNHVCVRQASVKMLEYLIEQVGCALGYNLCFVLEGILYSYSYCYIQPSRSVMKNAISTGSITGRNSNSNEDYASDSQGSAGSACRMEGVLDQVVDAFCRLLPLIEIHILQAILTDSLIPMITSSLQILDSLMSKECIDRLPGSDKVFSGHDDEDDDVYGATDNIAIVDSERRILRKRGLTQALRLTDLILSLVKGDISLPPEFVVRLFQLLVHSRFNFQNASAAHSASASSSSFAVMDSSKLSQDVSSLPSSKLGSNHNSKRMQEYLSLREIRRAAIHTWEAVHTVVSTASRGLLAARCQQYMELFCGLITELLSEKRRRGFTEGSMDSSDSLISMDLLDKQQIMIKVEVRDMSALNRLVRFIKDFVDVLEPLKPNDSVPSILSIFELQRSLSQVLSRLCTSLMLDIALYEARASSRLSDESSMHRPMGAYSPRSEGRGPLEFLEDEALDIGFGFANGRDKAKDREFGLSEGGNGIDQTAYAFQLTTALNLVDSVWQSHTLVASLLPNNLNLDGRIDVKGNQRDSGAVKYTMDLSSDAIPGETVLAVVVQRMQHRSPPASLLKMLIVMVRRISETILSGYRSFRGTYSAPKHSPVMASFSKEGKDRIHALLIGLLRAVMPWISHASNEEIFALVDELLPACVGSLTCVDILLLVDTMTNQGASVHVNINRIDSSLRLLASLIVTIPPLDPARALASMDNLTAANQYLIRNGWSSPFLAKGLTSRKRLLNSSFPSQGFQTVRGSSSRERTGFESFFLHVVLVSCFDNFDHLCSAILADSEHGFRLQAEGLDHMIEHAAFVVRCLRTACLPNCAVDHRDYVNMAFGDIINTCMVMQEHLDARIRLIGLEIFTSATEIMQLSSALRPTYQVTMNGEVDGELLDVALPRGRACVDGLASGSCDFEEKGWNMLSMFMGSLFSPSSRPDLDLQYSAMKYIRNSVLRAFLGLNGSRGIHALSLDHVAQLWEAVARMNDASWRELSLQSHISCLILCNVAMFLVFAARGRSQTMSRLSSFTAFCEDLLFVWIEQHLTARSRQYRFWGARLLECYLRGIELNAKRHVTPSLPKLPIRVWRALRAVRQDWYVDLAVLADSLLGYYWDKPSADGSTGPSSGQMMHGGGNVMPPSAKAVDALNPSEVILWFPDVAEEALGDVIQEEGRFAHSFAQYMEGYISGEDDHPSNNDKRGSNSSAAIQQAAISGSTLAESESHAMQSLVDDENRSPSSKRDSLRALDIEPAPLRSEGSSQGSDGQSDGSDSSSKLENGTAVSSGEKASKGRSKKPPSIVIQEEEDGFEEPISEIRAAPGSKK